MKKSIFKLPLAILASAVIFTACEEDTLPQPIPQEKTIAGTAADVDDFSILVDALTRAGLVSVLDDASTEFTVFAPDNDAFQSLLTDLNLADLDALENALGTDGLKNVLLYHVLSGEVTAAMVSQGYVTTLAMNGDGDNLSAFIGLDDGDVVLNDESDVEQTDIQASNGVIHRIDAVILPASVYELISFNEDEFSSLETALEVADGDLDDVLDDETMEYTLFAPDNDAFNAAIMETSSGDLTGLVGTLGGTAALSDVLLYHVLGSIVRADGVSAGMVMTANGDSFTIDTSNGVSITDGQARTAMVTQTDITGTNGVIHKISKVLLP